MVLLGGDLFHDNKPSRKSMYQVMRTLRKNCLGMKPCEIEFLSDANEVFDGAFTSVNYEDPDINISIPVFSIHGNHDDPSGDGHFCSLDLLQCAGLVNYFGRVPEADSIEAKPVLLQKGSTKMALYGLSNVRDERMFRTFRDNKVKWFRPGQQQGDWFNLLTVHQNHHAHTATGYLPENVLPEWMDLIIWGHEHECLIDPRQNPETGFHVMQPGSSVATSLVPGEAVQKHVTILSIKGKEFRNDNIPLKTVRPFVTRELTLASDPRFKGLEHRKENRQELTKRLMEVVDDMIEEANADWEALHEGEDYDPDDKPLPLIRLRVEYTSPEGGQYDCENPQRFSNRFVGRVANTNSVVAFYRKKTLSRSKVETNDISPEAMEGLELEDEAMKVEALVSEFLAAQSLKILPQAPFGDAVSQFVKEDNKHAMETFLSDSLTGQQTQILSLDVDEDLDTAMEEGKKRLEQLFAMGQLRRVKRKRVKEKPAGWDSDLEGHWEDQPGVVTYERAGHAEGRGAAKSAGTSRTRGRGVRAPTADEDDEDVFMEDTEEVAVSVRRNAAERTGRAAASTTTKTRTTKAAVAPKKTAAAARKAAPVRRRGKAVVIPAEDDELEDEQPEQQDPDIFVSDEFDEPVPPPSATIRPRRAAAMRQVSGGSTARVPRSQTSTSGRGRPKAAGAGAGASSQRTSTTGARGRGGKKKQTTLNFSQTLRSQTSVDISDDEVSEGQEDEEEEDDDAFDSMPTKRASRCRSMR